MAASPELKGLEVPPAKRRPVLLIFWGVFAAIVAVGIGILQYLGPPPAPPLTAAAI